MRCVNSVPDACCTLCRTLVLSRKKRLDCGKAADTENESGRENSKYVESNINPHEPKVTPMIYIFYVEAVQKERVGRRDVAEVA